MDLGQCLAGDKDKRAWDAFVRRFGGVIYSAVVKTIRAYAGRNDPAVAEVAETPAIDPQTVRSQRHKAIEKLREYFGRRRR